MRKMTIASLAALAMILVAGAVPAQGRGGNAPQRPGKPDAGLRIKVDLVSVGGSGVTGFVELAQLGNGNGDGNANVNGNGNANGNGNGHGNGHANGHDNGGTSIHVVAKGLQPGTTYALFSGSGGCSAPGDFLGNLTGNSGGVDQFQGYIDLDLSRIGSVSVRLGPGFGTLVACASLATEALAPSVSSTVPANVAINANLTAAFTEAMDPLTITTTSFTLKQGVTPIAGTVSYIGVTATFAPAVNLAPLTTYTATITTAAKDLAGNALVSDFSWSFTTGVTPDIIAPTVSSTIPVNAATGVGLNQKLSATFSEAMDPLTITTTSFTLKHGTIGVAGIVSYTESPRPSPPRVLCSP
jgi:hypothetical protein